MVVCATVVLGATVVGPAVVGVGDPAVVGVVGPAVVGVGDPAMVGVGGPAVVGVGGPAVVIVVSRSRVTARRNYQQYRGEHDQPSVTSSPYATLPGDLVTLPRWSQATRPADVSHSAPQHQTPQSGTSAGMVRARYHPAAYGTNVVNMLKLLFGGLFGTRRPITKGTIQISGPNRDIKIRRDRFGVPHINAATDHDAWFGMGFCQGQDRSFQIETLLRVVRGTVSELVGADALPIDRISRRVGFRQIGEATLEALDEDVRLTFGGFHRRSRSRHNGRDKKEGPRVCAASAVTHPPRSRRRDRRAGPAVIRPGGQLGRRVGQAQGAHRGTGPRQLPHSTRPTLSGCR